MMIRWWWPLVIVVSLVGCAPWTQVGGTFRDASLQFQAELPPGWMRSNTAKDFLLITRDGVLLQYIAVQGLDMDQELKHTKKKFTRGMLPQEVAEIELDEVRSNPAVMHFALLENVPTEISGQPGFKLVYTYRTQSGLLLKRVHYGLLQDNRVYRILYQAPGQYYFDRDLDTFERVRESVQLSGTT
jgi:hypothetical protein